MDNNNQYTSPQPGIYDVTAQEGDNLVLLYGHSDSDTYRALGFQVTRGIRRIERMPVDITLAADTGIGFGTLTDSGHTQQGANGNDIFRIGENRDQTIEEYGIGVNVSGVDGSELLVAYEGASGDPVIGVQGDDTDRARGFGVDAFPERGAVTADLTTIPDIDFPTTSLSPNPLDQGVIRIDSREDGRNTMRFGFHNSGTAEATISVFGIGMAYRVRQVTDTQTIKDMVTPGGVSARPVTWGGFDNTTPNLPRDWTDYTISVRERELVPPLN